MLTEFSMAISGLRWLALAATVRHNSHVAETTATGRGNPIAPRRTTATKRYFFVRPPLRAFFGRAVAGPASAGPVPLDAGFPPSLRARPPHVEMGSGSNPSKEATMLATSLRTPAHPSPYLHGVNAARTWLESPRPGVSLHDWRALHRAGAADPAAFDRGFADGVAYLFTQGGHHVA